MDLKYISLVLMSTSIAVNAGSMGADIYAKKWAGFYIGGNLGAGWQTLDNRLTIVNNAINPLFYPPSLPGVNQTGSNSFEPLRFVGGVQAGFNKELPHQFMAGLEISYDYLNLSQTVQGLHQYSNDPIQRFYTIKNVASATQIGTLRPRLGYHLDDYLFYLSGGGAITDIKYHQTITDYQYAVSNTTTLNSSRYGWVLGGGVEYLPIRGISFKMEYLYADFGYSTLTNQWPGTGSLAGLSATVHNELNPMTIQTLLFGLNWHFA